jgi:hypothetical protein
VENQHIQMSVTRKPVAFASSAQSQGRQAAGLSGGMDIDQEFERAITADVDVVLQQTDADAAERVEQLAEVLLSYAEGEWTCQAAPPFIRCVPLLAACVCFAASALHVQASAPCESSRSAL